MTLGEYMREFRAVNRLSQRDLARSTGLSPGYISQLESGKNPRTGEPIAPSVETLKALARVTGKDIDVMLDLLDDETLVKIEEPTVNEDDELERRIMLLVRRLPRELKLSLLDLLSVTAQGVKK